MDILGITIIYFLLLIKNCVNTLENLQYGTLKYNQVSGSDWPKLGSRKLGSVSAVTINNAGNVMIFHRGSHIWNAQTFNLSNYYLLQDDGPIDVNTILEIDRNSGQVVNEWGKNLFYVPHGLTIDKENNAWITDVALHQVFKFNLNKTEIDFTLVLGQRFLPGSDYKSFCKPTSVAVLDNGDFFVADGYCNSRILKYTSDGKRILVWGKNSFSFMGHSTIIPENYFAIPHSLTLVPEMGLLCVADRENGRIQCFHQSNGTFYSQFKNTVIGDRLFSVAYSPIRGGLLYVVNGKSFNSVHEIGGYVIEMTTSNIIGRFYPNNTNHNFSNPHDIAVNADGSEVYVAELDPTLIHKFVNSDLPKITTTNQEETTSVSKALIMPTVISEVDTSQVWVLVVTGVVLIVFVFTSIKLLTRKVVRTSETQVLYRRNSTEPNDDNETMMA